MATTVRAKLPTDALLSLALAIFSAAAALPMPYDYYTILRWVVLVGGSFVAWKSRSLGELWPIAVIAAVAIFNPLFPLRLERATWKYLDIAVAVLFLLIAGVHLAQKRPT